MVDHSTTHFRMARRRRSRFLFAAGISFYWLVFAHEIRVQTAAACENAMEYDGSRQIRQIIAAEQALALGKHRQAVDIALRTFPDLRSGDRLKERGPAFGLSRVAARAQRVVAVAIVRSDGLLAVATSGGGTVVERRANLDWAIAVLDKMIRVESTPALRTDLGEALSKLPETRGEALTTLEALDKKDLITTAQGYAALAELRLAAGDQVGHDAALRRAEAMTGAKGRRPSTSRKG